MNAEAIQKKLEQYYNNATQEQVLKEFEALGVEFVIIPEVQRIEFGGGLEFPFEFNDDFRSWLDNFLVDFPETGSSDYSSNTPAKVIAPQTQEDATLQTAGNYQYAMAA